MAKQLTATKVKTAKPKEKPYKLGAGGGLYLLVNPSGSKLWRLKYRIDGKEKTLSFGSWPEISLKQARKLRDDAKSHLVTGVDPVEAQRAEIAKKITFADVAERWYKGHAELAARPWAPATAQRARRYLDKDILPTLGHYPIKDITRRQLVALNERVEKRGAIDIAKKIRGWLAAIFDEALDREEIPFNPAHRLKPSHYASGAETRHYAFVPFSELPELLNAIDNTGANIIVKHAVKILIYTGVRTGELRFSTWPEFDLETATWSIPAERMKMRRPHVVPLPPQAVEIMRQLEQINGDNPYPFTLTAGKPLSENTITKTIKTAGYKDRQTGHGFRHLISTELNERGYNADWVEIQLAHKVSDNKIRSTYNHATYIDERRRMMADWANTVDAACRGADIVAIGSKRA